GKLSAMMDGMAQTRLQKAHRWTLEQATKIYDFGQLLSIELLDLREPLVKHLIEPGGNLGGVAHRIGPRDRSEVEGTGTHATQKAFFSGDNVPGELQRSLGNCIGAIVAFIERDRFNHSLGDGVLCLEGR